MNLLPHSNGVRRVNMKRQRTTKEKLKNMAKVLMGIIIAGFIVQQITNFIAGETLIERVDYTTVDDKRMDFRLSGSGNYTVVFDGVLGGNLEVWNTIASELEENDNVATFFLFGSPDAVSKPAAFLSNTAAGGVLVMTLKDLS